MGVSYSNLIAQWWNYIMTLDSMPPARFGMFLFLVGNVEGQPAPLSAQNIRVRVAQNVAVFFPVLCEINAARDFPANDTEIKRRLAVQRALSGPAQLKVDVNGFSLSGVAQLSDYYAESPDFIFDVPADPGTLHSKFNPAMNAGNSRAVAAGYYLLLKPPNRAVTYTIGFDGTRNDGYHSKATYEVEFVP
jgi:hypothetical protein